MGRSDSNRRPLTDGRGEPLVAAGSGVAAPGAGARAPAAGAAAGRSRAAAARSAAGGPDYGAIPLPPAARGQAAHAESLPFPCRTVTSTSSGNSRSERHP
ncbi:hypothetical protein [Streptomyces sp. NPDC020996]|uniref:hypothetical protein n=1 Tax=Streptomyces sp. NPDC020996 TaxID=3154791 RepID=UPI0033D42559